MFLNSNMDEVTLKNLEYLDESFFLNATKEECVELFKEKIQ